MKSITTREILEAMHAAPKAPRPTIGGQELGGGAVIDKPTLFALVKTAREMGVQSNLGERAKAGDAVSDKTAKTYAATVSRRMDLGGEGGGRLMAGVSASSWHATRAALTWGAARAWRDEMRAADRAQRSGDIAGSIAHVRRAIEAARAVRSVEAAERPAQTQKRKTKRATLPRAPGWQGRVFEAATLTQKPAVAVLWATGCRPAEIEKGVDVGRDDRGRLMVRIPGAKVHEGHGAGQPFRRLLIDEDTEAGAALAAILGDAKKITVQRGAARLNKDFASIRDRIGGSAAPYSMRHQAAAELKATMDAEGVAAALGHRVTRSQSRYGAVKQAKGGGAIKAARATYPVKETRPSALQQPIPDRGPGLG